MHDDTGQKTWSGLTAKSSTSPGRTAREKRPRPTSGRVAIHGVDPATHQNEVRKSFGIVFQDPSLDDELTAWENMDLHGALYGFPCKLRHDRTEMLL